MATEVQQQQQTGGSSSDASAGGASSKPLPIIKHIHDMSQVPQDYGTTPGGTMFSTTPGGTRIIYKRKELLELRSSPLARTPPSNMASIPGVTSPTAAGAAGSGQLQTIAEQGNKKAAAAATALVEDPQFDMDM